MSKKGQKFGLDLTQLARVGLLPTPQAIDGSGKGRDLRLKTGNRDPLSPGSWRGDLKDFAHMKLLPTPKANDAEKRGQISADPRNGVPGLAMNGLLPTPAAQDGQNATFPISQKDRDTVPGFIMRNQEIGKASHLNPRFVLEMMGFPSDWTLLPFLEKSNPDSLPMHLEDGATNQ